MCISLEHGYKLILALNINGFYSLKIYNETYEPEVITSFICLGTFMIIINQVRIATVYYLICEEL